MRVESDSDTCATISIQKNICPIHDLKYDIEYDGMYQSMTRLAAITVTPGFSVSYLYISITVPMMWLHTKRRAQIGLRAS